jgi:hypothetical protein
MPTETSNADEELVLALTPKQLALVALAGALILFWRRRRKG